MTASLVAMCIFTIVWGAGVTMELAVFDSLKMELPTHPIARLSYEHAEVLTYYSWLGFAIIALVCGLSAVALPRVHKRSVQDIRERNDLYSGLRGQVLSSCLDEVRALMNVEHSPEDDAGYQRARALSAAHVGCAVGGLDPVRKGKLLRALRDHGWLTPGSSLTLAGTDFSFADLRTIDLTGAALSGISFQGAKLGRANLSGADLSRCDLTGVDLTEAILRKANLQKANLTYALLRRADLRGADLRNSDLRCADLWDARITNTALDSVKLFANELNATRDYQWASTQRA